MSYTEEDNTVKVWTEGDFVYKSFSDHYQFLKELSFNSFLKSYGRYEVFQSADYTTRTLVLRRGIALDENTIFSNEVIEGMVDRVYYLHRMGIIHGDIKPSNFILFRGKIEIIDFGASRFTRKSQTILQTIYPANSRPRDKEMSEFSEVYCLGRLLNLYYYERFQLEKPAMVRKMTRSNRKYRCTLSEVRDFFVPEVKRKEYTCSYYDEVKDRTVGRIAELQERILSRSQNRELLKYAEIALTYIVDWQDYAGTVEGFKKEEYLEFREILQAEDFYPFSQDF